MGNETPHWLSWMKLWMRDLPHRSLAICLMVALFAALVLTFRVPLLYDLLDTQDLHLQDQYFAWRDALGITRRQEVEQDKDIIVISVDDESARRLGMSLPWPRQMYAYLVSRLHTAGARVIAFDMLLEGRSPIRPGGPSTRLKALLPPDVLSHWSDTAEGDDRALAEQFASMRKIVLADTIEVNFNLFNGRSQSFYQLPNERFIVALGSDASSIGNVAIRPDPDGVVRRAPVTYAGFRHLPILQSSLALRVAEKVFQSRAAIDRDDRVNLSEMVFPPTIRINYLGGPGTINSIPFWRAIDWERHFNSNPFQHKVVLVGYQDSVSHDESGPTGVIKLQSFLPFNSFLTPTAGFARPMSSVELQATLVQNILIGRYLTEPDLWEEILLVMFVALLIARFMERLQGRPWSMLGMVVCVGAMWLLLSFLSFCYFNCMIPVVVPIVGVALPAWFLVLTDQNLYFSRERRKHTKIFKYLAPRGLAQEIDRRQLVELGLQGKTALVTTLFCQMQNFVAVTEQKSPEAVINMLNECISEMMNCVYECNGLVTSLSNYGVMAVWGAPLPAPEESQCRLAATCAIDIQQKLLDLTASWKKDGRIDSNQSLECLFGISTGEAACGRIGSESHTEYSVIGRSVDLAPLLESLNKRYCTKCLVSERTAQMISQHFECRELDKLKIGLNDKPQYIYELFCQKGKLPGAMDEAIALYKQGLAAIEERNFEEAERLFSTILRLVPDERPAAIMLERCREYLRKPPELDWDGAILVADLM